MVPREDVSGEGDNGEWWSGYLRACWAEVRWSPRKNMLSKVSASMAIEGAEGLPSASRAADLLAVRRVSGPPPTPRRMRTPHQTLNLKYNYIVITI